MRRYLIVGALLLCASFLFADDSVWWEGEDVLETNFPASTWFSETTFRDKVHLLSGGKWLTNADKRTGPAAYARYSVNVPAGGRYRFWCRKFWKHGPFTWRFDDQPWRTCTKDVLLTDSVEIRQHLCVNWVYLGRVALARGAHVFELRLLAGPGEQLTACFDAFYLTGNDAVVPGGAQRPLPPEGKPGPADWFPVAFYEDEFEKDSVIDMSALVEAPAGKYGFLKMKNGELRFEKSAAPVRFWGCGADFSDVGRDEMSRRARYLRKHGVRMVRQHPLQSVLGLLRPDGTLDPKALDKWDWWFAELKKNGIYMTWSLFYPHHVRRDEGYDLFDELPEPAWWMNDRSARSTSGLVNIEPALQDSEWRWAKAVLTHRNPYTGRRYVDDPALAVLEVHNEDCIFWHWPLNDLAEGKKMPRHSARLKRRWADWLKNEYGGDDALRRAWGAGMRTGDSLANPDMKIYAAWEMEADGPRLNKAEKQRMGDFVRFLTVLQRGYYEKRIGDLRSAGYKAVTITTAWRAGGPAADPANLYCDTAADMVSRHNYSGGGDGGHNIRQGKLDNFSHLGRPGSGILSSGMYQVDGRAFCMTEWTQKPPNQWKLEIAPLVAFYGMGLQGWDASFHFLNSGSMIGNGWPALSSYCTDTPHYIGQFPALAFAVYNGHIATPPPAAVRTVPLRRLFAGIDPLGQDFTGGGHDDKVLRGDQATPQEYLAIGPVLVSFDGRSAGTAPPARCWDRERRVVVSTTGELEWHYGRQLVLVKSPRTQAVIGKASDGPVDLPAVTLDIDTPFVSVIFTPLDNRELRSSRHVLITALARDRQTGTEYGADGTQLLKVGHPPLLLEPVRATVRLKGSPPRSVNVLDVYGVPTGATVPVDAAGSFRVDGTFASYYYEVKR
ncbi:MAG: beta-galactosidase [Planctomycetes bacterium]|nr:beta-galactosidase [Planctomycetota bacterium]